MKMKLNSIKTLKKLHLLSLTIIVTLVSCDFNNQESNIIEKDFSRIKIEDALTNVELKENGVSAVVNRSLLEEVALKNNEKNDFSSQELYFLTDNELRQFVEKENGNDINLSRTITKKRKIRIIDGGGSSGSTLTVYSTSATVYGPSFQNVEDYRFTYDEDAIIQSTAKKYTGMDFIGTGNYGTQSIVSKYEVYPDGTYVNGTGEFLCYNEWHRANLSNGSISCDDQVILRAKATLGNNFPGMTSCSADIYCDD
jgi:hypothetical protein